MKAVLRHLATLLALVALSATAVAGLEASTAGTAADAHDARATAPATHGCAQAMAAAENGDAGAPHCPSAPLTVSGPCGGPVALPVESRAQFDPESAADPLGAGPEEARDLLLVVPFFRPPIA